MNYHIQKRSITANLLKSVTSLISCFFIITIIWQSFSAYVKYTDEQSSVHSTASIPTSTNVIKNNNSLTYKLIALEKKWQLADQEEKAKYNFDWFFQEALKIETPNKTTQEVKAYFQQISSLLNKHFIYKANTTLTEGLSNQEIDCDLRSYLFYDITQKIGLNTSIVYSPGHAFILWKSPNEQIDLAWETTEKGQGRAVSLTDSLYKTTYDGITYRPTTEGEVIALYEVFTVIHAYENKKTAKQTILNKVSEMEGYHPDWHFLHSIKAHYLYDEGKNKGKEFVKDVAKKILEMQPANSGANYMLMAYFYSHGDNNKALDFFQKIKPKDKDYESRLIYANSQTSWLRKNILKADAYLYKAFWNITAYDNLKQINNLHRGFLVFVLIAWLLKLFLSLKDASRLRDENTIKLPNVTIKLG